MQNGKRPRRPGIGLAGALLGACLSGGCATPASESPETARSIDAAVYQRALLDRSERLEAEVARLRADLGQAEEALVRAESGLRGSHSRADAVSSLAEVRIQMERAAGRAPWRAEEIEEARLKLEEADRQIDAGHFGAALFFVYRTARIAEQLEAEAESVRGRPGTLYVRSARVNLRAGPSTDEKVVRVLGQGTPVFPERTRNAWMLVRIGSGSVGWVYANLLTGGE